MALDLALDLACSAFSLAARSAIIFSSARRLSSNFFSFSVSGGSDSNSVITQLKLFFS